VLRDELRALVAKGIDPRAHRRKARQAAVVAAENTFEAVFRRWRDFKALSLQSGHQSTLSQIDRIFAKDVLPKLGKLSAFDITVAVPQPPVSHNPFLRMDQLPEFLCKLHGYDGDINTQLGLRLLLLTGVRTGELRFATPDQFDLERGLRIIPAVIVKQLQRRAREKNREIPPYIVPLSRQGTAIVKKLLAEVQPAQRYLLPHRGDLQERISETRCFPRSAHTPPRRRWCRRVSSARSFRMVPRRDTGFRKRARKSHGADGQSAVEHSGHVGCACRPLRRQHRPARAAMTMFWCLD
jgi:integrase